MVFVGTRADSEAPLIGGATGLSGCPIIELIDPPVEVDTSGCICCNSVAGSQIACGPPCKEDRVGRRRGDKPGKSVTGVDIPDIGDVGHGIGLGMAIDVRSG